MAVVSLREMLEDARRGGYAVPLFDTQNMAMIRSAPAAPAWNCTEPEIPMVIRSRGRTERPLRPICR